MAAGSKPENARARKPLTQERLKELLNYDPETGIWKWRVDRYAGEYHSVLKARKGDVAGTPKRQGRWTYRKISVEGRSYRSGRLAYFYVTGNFPDIIDNIDGDGTNDRWANLRPCTIAQNSRNTRLRSNNTSGIKGVRWYGRYNKWHAQYIDKRQ